MASFRELLKEVENANRSGFKNGAWFPHKSPEGGTRTLGYGHKLTQQEEDGNYVILPNGKVVDFSQRGLTDDEVDLLLDADIQKHKSIAATQWDNSQKTPFSSLNPMHQAVLTEIVYNIGTLKNSKGKWGWPSLAKGILNDDPDVVKQEIMRSYTNPNGKRVELTSRVNKIRGFIDQYNTDPTVVSLEGFDQPQGQAPEEPQMSYSKLLQGVMSELDALSTPPQSAPQEPTEDDKINELMGLIQQDLSQEDVISRGERRLAKTYQEVIAEEESQFSDEDEQKIQELMGVMKGERVVLRETTNPFTGEEEQPQERENDPSKDPIYGLF